MPHGVGAELALARLATIGTRASATMGTRASARIGARASAEGRLEVGVAGSGSNLLIADADVRGQLLKPDKELLTIEIDRADRRRR